MYTQKYKLQFHGSKKKIYLLYHFLEDQVKDSYARCWFQQKYPVVYLHGGLFAVDVCPFHDLHVSLLQPLMTHILDQSQRWNLFYPPSCLSWICCWTFSDCQDALKILWMLDLQENDRSCSLKRSEQTVL